MLLSFEADLRIDRAVMAFFIKGTGKALEAAQAFAHLILFPGLDLHRKIRIRHHLSGQKYDIRLTGGDDLFHVFRV